MEPGVGLGAPLFPPLMSPAARAWSSCATSRPALANPLAIAGHSRGPGVPGRRGGPSPAGRGPAGRVLSPGLAWAGVRELRAPRPQKSRTTREGNAGQQALTGQWESGERAPTGPAPGSMVTLGCPGAPEPSGLSVETLPRSFPVKFWVRFFAPSGDRALSRSLFSSGRWSREMLSSHPVGGDGRLGRGDPRGWPSRWRGSGFWGDRRRPTPRVREPLSSDWVPGALSRPPVSSANLPGILRSRLPPSPDLSSPPPWSPRNFPKRHLPAGHY